MWAIVYDHIDLRGTTGSPGESPLLSFLESLGFESIDIQYGDGYLNYINGYVIKASDAIDFRLKEHLRQGESHRWRIAYRMLCKCSPCVPEVYVDFAGLPLMHRSFQVGEVYPPIPKPDIDLDQNDSYRLYSHFLSASRRDDGSILCDESFLRYARRYRVSSGRLLRRQLRDGEMVAIGVRFSYELLDISIGQFVLCLFYFCQFCFCHF